VSAGSVYGVGGVPYCACNMTLVEEVESFRGLYLGAHDGRGGEYCVLYLGTKDIGICLGIFWQLVDQ